VSYSQSIKSDPNNVYNIFKRSILRVNLGDYIKAQEDVDQIMQLMPGSVNGDYVQGLIYYHTDRHDKSRRAFDRVVKYSRAHKSAIHYLSLIHYGKGNYELAESLCRELLVSDGGSISLIKLLSVILLQNKKYEEAESFIRSRWEYIGEDVDLLNFLATALMNQKKTDEAIFILNRVDDVGSSSPEVKFKLGALHMMEGRDDVGVAYVEESIDLDPKLYQADIMLVSNYLKNNQLDLALQAAEVYRDKNSESPVPNNLIGGVYVALKSRELAVSSFNKALAIEPGDPMARHALADMSIERGDFLAAREHFKQVLDHRGEYYPTLMKLVALDAAQKKEALMVEHLNRALLSSPDQYRPKVMLARYYLASDMPEKVKGLFLGSVETKDMGPGMLKVVALADLKLEAYEEAKYYFERIIALGEATADIYHYLALAYAGIDSVDEMTIALERALELDPKHLPARLAFTRYLINHNVTAASEHIVVLKGIAANSAPVLEVEAAFLLAQGKRNDALILSEAAYLKSPTEEGMLSYTKILWLNGEVDKAISVNQQWIDTHPSSIPSMLALATAQLRVKNSSAAKYLYTKVIEIDSDNAVALNNMAWLLRDEDNILALEYASRARALKPQSQNALDTLAVVLLKNGDSALAKKTISKALAINPDNSSVKYHRAMIDVAMGDQESAVSVLTEIIESDTKFPERTAARNLMLRISADR